MSNKPKSVWTDISHVWGRIAGVIAAVGIIATFITKVFNTPPELTYSIFAGFGTILLLISFYVDKQTEITYSELKENFTDLIKTNSEQAKQFKEDSDKRINLFQEDVSKIVKVTEETRKDTLRIQLLMLMKEEENNVDTILRIAETYFVDLQGDWYMTNEFNKWAKRHDVIIPTHISRAIGYNHKEVHNEN